MSFSQARRWFLWLTASLAGAASAIALALPLGAYLLGRRRVRRPWIVLGEAAAFPENQTRLVEFENPLRQPWDGRTAATGVFVRNQGTQAEPRFLIFAVNCAHLGCPVTWFPASGLFLCPCHGGVYYADGRRASGPPPRGLFACSWRIRNGQLEIEAPHYPTLHDTLDSAEDPA